MFAMPLAACIVGCSGDAKQDSAKPAPTAKLPTALQGLWLADAEECGKPDWTEGYQLNGAEISVNNGTPVKIAMVEERPDGDVFVKVDDPEAGWSFNGEFLFSVDPTDGTLSNSYDNRTAGFALRKCQ